MRTYRYIIPILILLLLCTLLTTPAHAQDSRGVSGTAPGSASGGRVALVIGNSGYTGISPLANPVNDATDMAEALGKCGFTVMLKTNCNLRTMLDEVDAFARRIRGVDAAVFFYAGHGVEVEGQNYLIPIGANIGVEKDVRTECMNLERVLNRIEDAEPKVSVLILDACRNNSLPKQYRSVAGGLAPMNAGLGTIIAYSTSPGSVAKDGVGQRNSPYTAGLLKHLATPGLSARDMFDAVRLDVVNQTDHRQEPWESTKMIGRFYFVPSDGQGAPPPTVASAPPPPAPMAMTGHLQVNVNVPDATVRINGQNVGTASPGKPLDVENLPVGPAKVMVEAEGLVPVIKTVQIARSEWTQAVFDLVRKMLRVEGPKPGDMDVVDLGGGVKLELVYIPPGTFMMGSPESEEERSGDEGPVHEVAISRGFWMGKYEVTQGQWQEVMGSTPGYFKGDSRLPMETVSWDDCQEFLQEVSNRTGHTYRLPTEAEWEYACRAGTRTPFFFGNTISTEQANYDGDYIYGNGQRGVDRNKTMPVGSFVPNDFGLYDMHGNVFEWCADAYREDYYGQSPKSDPQGPDFGELQVLRGGAWYFNPVRARSANRANLVPTSRISSLGFRLVRSP